MDNNIEKFNNWLRSHNKQQGEKTTIVLEEDGSVKEVQQTIDKTEIKKVEEMTEEELNKLDCKNDDCPTCLELCKADYYILLGNFSKFKNELFSCKDKRERIVKELIKYDKRDEWLSEDHWPLPEDEKNEPLNCGEDCWNCFGDCAARIGKLRDKVGSVRADIWACNRENPSLEQLLRIKQ